MEKFNKKSKKTRKGMTLVEIIVALAVVSVLTVLLVQVSSTIEAYTKSANTVNKKVAHQLPVAETKYKKAAYEIDSTDDTVNITVHGIQYEGKGYTTVDPSAPVKEPQLGGNLALKFVDDIQVVTTGATTTAPATTTTAIP